MEEFETSLRSLQRRIDEKQTAYRAELEAETAAVVALQSLRARVLECRGAFDEEDACRIEACVQQHQRRRQELEREHSQRNILRQEKEVLFENMYRTMNERSTVLDAEDNGSDVLKQHRELLQFFAQKQVTMQSMLRREVDELLAEQ